MSISLAVYYLIIFGIGAAAFLASERFRQAKKRLACGGCYAVIYLLLLLFV